MSRETASKQSKLLDAVRENLQAYADRGSFRGFTEVKPGRFKFICLIRHQMDLV